MKTMRWQGMGATVLLAAGSLLAGCGLPAAVEQMAGKSVAAKYTGLIDKSVVIVIYADTATTSEYPQTRDDIASFLTKQFQLSASQLKVRLVRKEDVLRWQDETDWVHLTPKDIGQHFAVDRVLYVEVGQYTTRTGGGEHLIQGRIAATVQVYETDGPAERPAWSEPMEAVWPDFAPTDVSSSSDLVARKRVLELFSEQVVNSFFDHREFDKTIREKAD